MMQTGIQYKRSARGRKFFYNELPSDWTADDIRTYGKAKSELIVDVEVTCWHHDRIVCIYRNGIIVGGLF